MKRVAIADLCMQLWPHVCTKMLADDATPLKSGTPMLHVLAVITPKP